MRVFKIIYFFTLLLIAVFQQLIFAQDSGVQQAWAKHYIASDYTIDVAYDIGVDNSGNVYVTGKSIGSDNSYDYATVKYNADGVQEWVMRYEGPVSVDVANALALDKFGYVIVTGYSKRESTKHDYVTIKYGPDGNEIWMEDYNGPSNDAAFDITIDDLGNIYITGRSYDTDNYYDIVTIKYNSNGQQQWVARYNGSNNGNDMPSAVKVDSDGNVYVTGKTAQEIIEDTYDYVTIKYDSNGTEKWAKLYCGSADDTDEAVDLVLDQSGNVYVTGWSTKTNTGIDYVTIKYSAVTGSQQWVASYNRSGSGDDKAAAIGIDSSANVYVTGWTQKEPYGKDYTTIKYSSSGELKWFFSYDEDYNDDIAKAMVVDDSGNVYVTGESISSGNTGKDFATIKYNTDGYRKWIIRYDANEENSDTPEAITIDNSGNVYVTGQSSVSNNYVYTTVKYSQTTTAINEKVDHNPNNYWLAQNYPNPFNNFTTIRYHLPKPAYVSLKTYNVAGAEIGLLVSETQPAGEHKIRWEACNISSGIYFYRLESDSFVETKKLILIK